MTNHPNRRKRSPIDLDRAALAEFYALPHTHKLRVPTYEPFPFHTFAQIVGGTNWVIARRTPNIIARYGHDVICLSQARYSEAERLARLALSEGFD